MTPEDIYYASKFAILEMIKGGTVFVMICINILKKL